MQETLAAALGRVLRLPEPPGLTVAGRTDAGVHARGQVVHADVPASAWTTLAGQRDGQGAGHETAKAPANETGKPDR